MEKNVTKFIINLGGNKEEDGKFHSGDCDDNGMSNDSDRPCVTESL